MILINERVSAIEIENVEFVRPYKHHVYRRCQKRSANIQQSRAFECIWKLHNSFQGVLRAYAYKYIAFSTEYTQNGLLSFCASRNSRLCTQPALHLHAHAHTPERPSSAQRFTHHDTGGRPSSPMILHTQYAFNRFCVHNDFVTILLCAWPKNWMCTHTAPRAQRKY